MSKMNKRIKSAEYVSSFTSIFKCPVCDTSMMVVESKSLICLNNHTFDFTKQGYLNLMNRKIKTKYSKELFEARRKVIVEDGFFEPLNQAIIEIINKHVPIKKRIISVLDAGCGEGSHLSNICDMINSGDKKTVIGVGIDIAKEGIFLAARDYTNRIWAVADLANTPFNNQQFDVILNILSPSNYGEFNRLLKDDGIVVKVVPQKGYLTELRAVFFDEIEKQSYSNIDTVELFAENFRMVDSSRLGYTMALEKSSAAALIRMTPLSWGATKEQVKSLIEQEIIQVTVDLEILIGIK